jgi:hypothetical protein
MATRPWHVKTQKLGTPCPSLSPPLSARECVCACVTVLRAVLSTVAGAESPQVLQQASTAVADFPWLPISSKAFTPAPAAGRTAVHRPMGRSSFSSKKWGHPFMRLHGRRRRRPDKCTVRSWLASRVSFSP